MVIFQVFNRFNFSGGYFEAVRPANINELSDRIEAYRKLRLFSKILRGCRLRPYQKARAVERSRASAVLMRGGGQC
jgi:hypothetical protein